jgi:hypothetical protein
MKELKNTLNNDFFYLVKSWLTDVDNNMKIKKNCKIEIKYLDGYHYVVYPLDCTLEQANEDIQWLTSSAGIAEEDNNLYIIKRINELLADAYEYNFDSMNKGNI